MAKKLLSHPNLLFSLLLGKEEATITQQGSRLSPGSPHISGESAPSFFCTVAATWGCCSSGEPKLLCARWKGTAKECWSPRQARGWSQETGMSEVRRPNSISFSELTQGMKEKHSPSNNRVPPSSLEEAFCSANADTGIDLAK